MTHRHENLRKILTDTNWKESIEKRRLEFQPIKNRITDILTIVFIILVVLLIAYLFGYSRAESNLIQPDPGVVSKSTIVTEEWSIPERQGRSEPYSGMDEFWEYADGLVPHPRREPDDLMTIKISRYDPQLGGTNCFRWGNGTCLSNLANGEDWRKNYGVSIAAPSSIPFGTVVEIGGRLWIVKDRGGKIVDTGNAVWVDQLSQTGIYPYGHEMLASFWYPEMQ